MSPAPPVFTSVRIGSHSRWLTTIPTETAKMNVDVCRAITVKCGKA
jgi:hypothetical protein